jgi:hypothetical protein
LVVSEVLSPRDAAAILLARAGTKVLVVDRDLALAERTVATLLPMAPPRSPMPPI